MQIRFLSIIFFSVAILMGACQNNPSNVQNTVESNVPAERYEHQLPLISKIAFGSCGHQDLEQPVLGMAASMDPDVFVFLGDNIYGDTYVMDTLRAKYERLGRKTDYQKLAETARILATWDDHDYGWNDSGRHYPYKEESKAIFMDFFKVGEDDVRNQRKGIYTSYYFQDQDDTLQILLLDTRTFRDHLRHYDGEPIDTVEFNYALDYYPYETTDSTLLGAEQWKWLEQQLKVPADLRLIASSTQFGISFNGYEAWVNFPHEQQKMLDLIRKTKAEGVFFISGDVHYGEFSKLQPEGVYQIYDLTSSGITSTWGFATPNENRIGGPVMENNFGWIEIDWSRQDPMLTWQIVDKTGKVRVEEKLNLSSLSFPKPGA